MRESNFGNEKTGGEEEKKLPTVEVVQNVFETMCRTAKYEAGLSFRDTISKLLPMQFEKLVIHLKTVNDLLTLNRSDEFNRELMESLILLHKFDHGMGLYNTEIDPTAN